MFMVIRQITITFEKENDGRESLKFKLDNPVDTSDAWRFDELETWMAEHRDELQVFLNYCRAHSVVAATIVQNLFKMPSNVGGGIMPVSDGDGSEPRTTGHQSVQI